MAETVAENVNKAKRGLKAGLKILLEHRLPKKLRYAKVYLEAGNTSLSFSLDGGNADWHASIGKRKRGIELTDEQYSRLRSELPAKEVLEEDGKMVVISNSAGYEEQWERPRWVLTGFRKSRQASGKDPKQ